ncbi:hypothetical protein [Nonomuraea soli]|uniref:Uncharacterized protein n=1 Tax=Nonomuraea soli TaxID=1032476 RepID=A0A7W0CLK4_9ACTN|nr:hypothetical protein [Nonomuraea soli]MBA2893279.1 hypothetical protein [Nonomuraea soli]
MTITLKSRALLTAAVATVSVGALLTFSARATPGDYGHANGAELTLPAIPEINQAAFQGTWGSVAVDDTPGTESAVHPTWPDPDGVTQYMTLATGTLEASGVDAPDAWRGSSNLVVDQFKLAPSAQIPLLFTGNVSNFAQCTEQADGFAAVQTAPGTIRVFGEAPAGGTALNNGGTVTRTLTGDQLGFPGVATADVTASRTDVVTPLGTLPAEARTEVTFTAVLRDDADYEIYSGDLAFLVLARTEANCNSVPTPTPTTPTPTSTTPCPTETPTTPTPTPTTTSPTPTPTVTTPTPTPTVTTPTPTPTITTPTPTNSIQTETPTPTPTTPTPTATSPSPTEPPTEPPTTSPKPTPDDNPSPRPPHDGGDDDGDMSMVSGRDELPFTGLHLVWPMAALAAIALGLTVRYMARRR